jgi:hypothetical protein
MDGAQPVSDTHSRRFDRRFDRLENGLPGFLRRTLRWLRSPAARLIRMPIGILFVIGGFMGFLPVLGFWMIPVGVLLLAQDITLLKRPAGQAMVGGERRLRALRRRWGF